MQRLVALTISDPEQLGPFAQEHAAILDVAAGATTGGWGLGFYGSGEMLVHITPASAHRSAADVLKTVRSRQLVLVADSAASLVSSRRAMQPLRYRDWAFAMSGGPAHPDAFVAAARVAVARFGSAGATVPEATLMVLMETLHRRGVLDGRAPTDEPVRRALAEGVAQVAALAGGPASCAVAALLLLRGKLFALAAGRPLWVQPIARRWREGARQRELTVTVVSDRALSDARELRWAALEIGEDGVPHEFALPAGPQ
jgi:hypothetical protein